MISVVYEFTATFSLFAKRILVTWLIHHCVFGECDLALEQLANTSVHAGSVQRHVGNCDQLLPLKKAIWNEKHFTWFLQKVDGNLLCCEQTQLSFEIPFYLEY